MFIVKILRRLRGFVRFTLKGGFPERFISLVSRDGIKIRDLHIRDGYSVAYVCAADYKKLRRHAKSCGCRIRIEKKFGFPFFLRRNRKRKGLAVGTVTALLMLFALSRSVWLIEVGGSTSLSEGEILFALRSQGVFPGALKSSINILAAEQNTVLSLPSVSRVALNLRGSKLYAVVSDRTVPPEIIPLSAPCNIVASRGGTVTRISAFCGIPNVLVGDSVAQGDLLVSGISESGNGVHAIAEVIARVPVKIEVFTPFTSTVKEYTGRKCKKTTLHFLNLNIPLSFFKKMSYNNYEVMSETEFLRFSGGSLPIGKTVTEYLEFESVQKTLSREEAAEASVSEARRRAEVEKRNATIISESESVIFLPDGALCTVELMLETDIAKEMEIYED